MNTRLRRFSEAEQALDKAEQMSTKSEEKRDVWFLRGATFERDKHYTEAEEQFKKVLVSDPENAPALNYLGYMLADQNMKLEEALGLYQARGGSGSDERSLSGFAGLGILPIGQV